MILKKGSFSNFAERVKAFKKKIIIYGAGVIGQVSAPYWIHQYQLDENVLCYVDADIHKHGEMIQVGQNKVPVNSLEVFKQYAGTYTILVSVSAFEPVVDTLEKITTTKDVETYFLPIMLLDIAHATKESNVVKYSQEQMIPKIIHYCWFSGKPIPDILKKCMDSWKRHCPDYEIIRWDESNYDISWNPYMRQAYRHQKWGFIPDVARLDILYRYGGIYLDTDVELLRNLDELLYQPAFCGVEKWGTVNFGGCSGAQAGNPLVKTVLDYRKDAIFADAKGRLNLTTCGYYETVPLVKKGMAVNGKTQILENGLMTVYSSDFFQPFDYVSGRKNITNNTFSIHYFSGTWLSEDAAQKRDRTRQHYEEFLNKLKE